MCCVARSIARHCFLPMLIIVTILAPHTSHAANPKGIALTIGLNKVNPAHYAGWSGELFACENDANDMANIAKLRGFTVTTILSEKATRPEVLKALNDAAKVLESGDIFVLSYSGHGGQVYDENGDEKSNGPTDVLDETWCLYDGQIIDDELSYVYRQFKPGVRIVVFSDSCHSGTVARILAYDQSTRNSDSGSFLGDSSGFRGSSGSAMGDLDLGKFFLEFDRNPTRSSPKEIPTGPPPYRTMPLIVSQRTWALNRIEYKTIGTKPELEVANIETRGDDGDIPAYGLLISGCQDNQLSKDGWLNGAFTGALKQVWAASNPRELGSYRNFHAAIVRKFETDPSQTPNYYPFGTSFPDFERQAPFTIDSP